MNVQWRTLSRLDSYNSVIKCKLKADRPYPCDSLAHRQTHWTGKDSSLPHAALGADRRMDRQTDGIRIWFSPSSSSPIYSVTGFAMQ